MFSAPMQTGNDFYKTITVRMNQFVKVKLPLYFHNAHFDSRFLQFLLLFSLYRIHHYTALVKVYVRDFCEFCNFSCLETSLSY